MAVLLVFTRAPMPLLFGPEPEAFDIRLAPDAESMRFLLLPTYFAIALMVGRHCRTMVSTVLRSPLLLLLVVICVISTVWSVSPADTLRRSLALAMTAAFGWLLADRYDYWMQLRLVGVALTIAIVGSVFICLAVPEIGVMQGLHSGAWRGLFVHKNVLGKLAVLDLVVVTVLTMRSGFRPWLAVSAVAALVAITMSSSLTAFALAVVAGYAAALVGVIRSQSRTAPIATLLLLSVGLLMLLIVLSSLDALLAAIGRDRTLTGRTEIWEEISAFVGARPWLGYGYSGGWVPDTNIVTAIQLAVDWAPLSAHNGYLDLLLQIGSIGIAVFSLLMIISIINFLSTLRSADALSVYWSAAFLSLMLVGNFVESAMLRQNEINTVLFVSTVLMLNKVAQEAGR